jgi:pyrroloquinoline quinone biosynthesis protein D
MSSASLGPQSRLALDRRFRLQWEPAQNAHVLLYPEGMIKLNVSAGEILKRCDGMASVSEITADLERVFAATGLSSEVNAFLEAALEKRWVELQT